jgi:large subunit ribosomal protein L5
MEKIKEIYQNVAIPELMKKFGYKNKMAVPRLEKIVINMGVGEGKRDRKILDKAVKELTAITGQRPVITKARRSIAGFNVRRGMAIGCKVTLRRRRMYEFFNKLVNVAIPRIRDFKGLSPQSFDTAGNYTVGIKEQAIFPEISLDEVDRIQGMNITIVTTAKRREEARELLQLLGMPFKKE